MGLARHFLTETVVVSTNMGIGLAAGVTDTLGLGGVGTFCAAGALTLGIKTMAHLCTADGALAVGIVAVVAADRTAGASAVFIGMVFRFHGIAAFSNRTDRLMGRTVLIIGTGHTGMLTVFGKRAHMIAVVPVHIIADTIVPASGNIRGLVTVAGAIVLDAVNDNACNINRNLVLINVVGSIVLHQLHGTAGPTIISVAIPVIDAHIRP